MRYVAVEQVEPGQRIRLEPGDYVPFDCERAEDSPVSCGEDCSSLRAAVSEAMLTGEALPVFKQPGDRIHAGSRVLGRPICARILRPYQESRLQQIADSIAQALTKNELRLRSADRIALWFVPLVVGISLATLGARAWYFEGWLDARVWMPAVSVLLIACPCAFGIAAASALAVAVGGLLERGVLVKDAGALERFATVDRLVFDKTGTLTTGLWQVQEFSWRGESDTDLLRAIAGAEAGVDHPVAHALRASIVDEMDLTPHPVSELRELPGQGLVARWDARELRVGRADLFDLRPEEEADELRSLVYAGWEGQVGLCVVLSDELRPAAKEIMQRLSEEGLVLSVLSGDRDPVVQAVARALGIAEASGGLLPEEKQARVQALAEAGHEVAFAGDGSNDAQAMAASSVAIGLRHGTDLNLSADQNLSLS